MVLFDGSQLADQRVVLRVADLGIVLLVIADVVVLYDVAQLGRPLRDVGDIARDITGANHLLSMVPVSWRPGSDPLVSCPGRSPAQEPRCRSSRGPVWPAACMTSATRCAPPPRHCCGWRG